MGLRMNAHISDVGTLAMTNGNQDIFKRQGSSEISGHQNSSVMSSTDIICEHGFLLVSCCHLA
jgi:hypothetical protein